MKKNIFSYSFVFLLIAFFTLSFSFISNKAEALTISPARMELSGDQGTTVTKDITLINDTANDATYYVTYANFEAQGETGSPLFVEPKSDLGTWMTTDRSVTLAPQESKVVQVTITIPKDAYAGGHFAVVFFGNAPSGDGQVSVGAKTGTLVLLTVNGDVLEAGGLASFNTLKHKYFYNSLPISFEFRWKNDGNDRVKPDGNISIRSLFFIPVGHIDANAVSGNILPHSTRLFNIDWIKSPSDKNDNIKSASFINSYFKTVSYQWRNFAVGPYLAHLDLVSGANKTHSTRNVTFFVFPWQLLLLMAIILIPLFFIGRFALRRYNKKIIEKARLGMNTPSDANNG